MNKELTREQKRKKDQFTARLGELIDPEAIEGWLHKPNPAFDGQKPIDLIMSDRMEELYAMLHIMQSGETSS